MILSNMPLVTVKVNRYLDQFPHLSHLTDDLLSQGNAGLVAAVNRMVGRSADKKKNPTGFMSLYIHHYVRNLLYTECAVKVPRTSYFRKKHKGQEIKVPVKEGSLTVDDVFQKEAQADPRAMVDFMDELLGACDDEKDRQLIQMRIENYSDYAIAEILGVPKSTVFDMRKAILSRFLERNPEYKQRD